MESAIPSVSTSPQPIPLKGKLTFALTMVSALGVLQIVFGMIIFGIYAFLSGQSLEAFAADTQTLLESELGLVLGMFAYTCAALSVIGLGFGWGPLWSKLTDKAMTSYREWLAWYPMQRLKLWMVPPLTLLVVIAAAQLVNLLIGPTAVAAQSLLFQTRLLQIIAIPVAGILAPLAEEVVFRGALYNALLGPKRDGQQAWVRHILPFIVTTLTFVLIHAVAGFEAVGSFVLLLILSAFLGLLRAITGSVKAAIAGHMTSNLASVAGLIAAETLGFMM